MQQVTVAEQKQGTWHGGQLHEIYRDPPHGDFPNGDYRLWIGTATIERSAAYSYFPAAERLHILLSGGGLALYFSEPDESITLATGESFIFSGERPLRVNLLGAPVFAFNLVYRSGLASGAEFVSLDATPSSVPGQTIAGAPQTQIIYVVSGSVVVQVADGQHLLAQGETLIWQEDGSDSQQVRWWSHNTAAVVVSAFVSDPQPATPPLPDYPTVSNYPTVSE